MSYLHNRMGAVTLAVAAAVLLLGAGCSKGHVPAGSAVAPTNTDAGSRGTPLPTKWSEYRSEKLGITIPYPEGWYVEEHSDGSIDFSEHAPPAYSDVPSQMWALARESTDVDAAVNTEFPNVYERGDVTRSGITMKRIVYPYDARLDPDKRMVAYVWMGGGVVHMVGGAENDPILEHAVDNVEVTR